MRGQNNRKLFFLLAFLNIKGEISVGSEARLLITSPSPRKKSKLPALVHLYALTIKLRRLRWLRKVKSCGKNTYHQLEQVLLHQQCLVHVRDDFQPKKINEEWKNQPQWLLVNLFIISIIIIISSRSPQFSFMCLGL